MAIRAKVQLDDELLRIKQSSGAPSVNFLMVSDPHVMENHGKISLLKLSTHGGLTPNRFGSLTPKILTYGSLTPYHMWKSDTKMF